MPNSLQVVVDGTYVSALVPWGDLEWSTVFPGGSDALSFEVARSHKIFRPDAIVELYLGGECLWCGTLIDPTRGEPLVAEGLHRKAEDYMALTSTFEATLNPVFAVYEASVRGMPFGSVDYLGGTATLDPDQPHSVAKVLDASALELGQEWAVDPVTRKAYLAPWATTPAFHLLPGVDGLAISREGYACQVFARYLDSGSSTYETISSHDTAAHDRWGHVERTLPDLLGEGVAMTATQAQDLVDGLMAQGASQIGWASPIEVQYGDVVNDYQQSVALHKITAGQVVRLHGLVEDVADLAGRSWVDVPVARVVHKDATATIEPRGLASPMNDALTGKRP